MLFPCLVFSLHAEVKYGEAEGGGEAEAEAEAWGERITGKR